VWMRMMVGTVPAVHIQAGFVLLFKFEQSSS
jgi:hypothetical protein